MITILACTGVLAIRISLELLLMSVIVAGVAPTVISSDPLTWPDTIGDVPIEWGTPLTAIEKLIFVNCDEPFVVTHQDT